mmetsp:Transcript_10257/g.35908  ORF Transcript_10257/g.35908 Transcript_10257/m.35908 type:complete len:238 (+) Transcript_10257:2274-2987(+)
MKKTVEHVECAFLFEIHLRAIKASAELDQLAIILGPGPQGTQFFSGEPKPVARIFGIHCSTRTQSIGPLDAEFVFELVLRHRQLVGRQESGLGGDRVVVLVHKHVLVDLVGFDDAFLHDANVFLVENLPHVVLDLGCHRVRLDEHKGSVLVDNRVGAAAPHDVLALRDAAVHVKVLQGVVERHLLLHGARAQGDLRVPAPLLDHVHGNVVVEQPCTEKVVLHGRAQPVQSLEQSLHG